MFRRLATTLILTLAAIGDGLAAEHRVSDAAGLAEALRSARSGDSIVLRPGEYGSLDYRNRTFSPPIEIVADDPAAPPGFTSMFLSGVSGVHLRQVAIRYGRSNAPHRGNVVEIRRGAEILLDRLSVTPAGGEKTGDDANGVMVRESARLRIVDSHISDTFRGVVVFDSNEIVVTRSVFRAIGCDGVVARGTVGLSIAENYFSDFDVVDPVRCHPDAIQIWSRQAARANENITISSNLIRRGRGDPTQGIFIRTEEIASKNILIEENVIDQSMGQGIAVQGAAGVVIRNNSVIPHDAHSDRPGVDVRYPVSEATVTNNIMIASRIAPGVDMQSNAIAGFHHPDVTSFVRDNISGGVVRNSPGDYLPAGTAGARRFVHDLWTGDDVIESGGP